PDRGARECLRHVQAPGRQSNAHLRLARLPRGLGRHRSLQRTAWTLARSASEEARRPIKDSLASALASVQRLRLTARSLNRIFAGRMKKYLAEAIGTFALVF